jgi:hypothetical protein
LGGSLRRVSNAEGGTERAEGESFGPLGIGGRMSWIPLRSLGGCLRGNLKVSG